MKVINVSQKKVNTFDNTLPVITIGDPDHPYQTLDNEQNRHVLRLHFHPGDEKFLYEADDQQYAFTEVMAKQVDEFINHCMTTGENTVLIQCGQGMIRSFTLCVAIRDGYPGVVHDKSAACVKDGMMDNHTYCTLMRYIHFKEC